MINSSNKAIENLNISTRKLIEDGEKIKNRENSFLEKSSKDLSQKE
jgi:hypothetical protein